MNESRKPDRGDVLDQDTLELLGNAQAGTELPSQRLARLRDRVMKRVDEEASESALYMTVAADDGEWVEVEPGLEKKILNVNEVTRVESYLLRMHPDAKPDRHLHEEDELCLVLEGDISFDDIQLEAGDFHMARKGSWHGPARTVHGVLLFLQTGVTTTPVTA